MGEGKWTAPECDQCHEPAMVTISWTMSKGHQIGKFCRSHADEFWRTFKNTPAGQTATFTEIARGESA